MESEQLFHRGYYRNSYNSITSASSDEELLDGAGVIMDFQTSEDDNLLDGDTVVGKFHVKTQFFSRGYFIIYFSLRLVFGFSFFLLLT